MVGNQEDSGDLKDNSWGGDRAPLVEFLHSVHYALN